jgi:hypothetical protein
MLLTRIISEALQHEMIIPRDPPPALSISPSPTPPGQSLLENIQNAGPEELAAISAILGIKVCSLCHDGTRDTDEFQG